MSHPALVPGAVALVTGAASGLGLEAAARFAELGLRVALVDLHQDRLDQAAAAIRARAPEADLATYPADVSDRAALASIKAALDARWGSVDVLMNNAAVSPETDVFGPLDAWERLLAVNLWGVIHGCQVFVPDMTLRPRPGLVINTGSKQGITTPPGNAGYNLSKAGVKVYTEALAHQLRNSPSCRVSVHLLIPGFVFTGLTARGRTEKPAGAWTPAQTIEFLLASLDRNEFYVLCPDNDTIRALDEKRMAWAMGDIIQNRPALSRWHPDHAEAFAKFVAE